MRTSAWQCASCDALLAAHHDQDLPSPVDHAGLTGHRLHVAVSVMRRDGEYLVTRDAPEIQYAKTGEIEE